MTFQMRPRGSDGVMYSPSRDIAYLFPSVMHVVAANLGRGRQKELDRWLLAQGYAADDLSQGLEVFVQFMVSAHQNSEENIEDVMRRVGWLDVPGPIQVALMYQVGAVLTGNFFRGLRDVVVQGEDTAASVRALLEDGVIHWDYTGKSRWSRWWYRIGLWWNRKRGKPLVTFRIHPLASPLGKLDVNE